MSLRNHSRNASVNVSIKSGLSVEFDMAANMSNRNFSGEPRPEKKKEGRTTADFTGSQEEILYEQITKLIKKGQNEENAKEAVNRFGEALAIAKTLNQDHITNTCEFNLAAAKIASDESVSDYMNSMKTNFDDNYEMEFNLGVMKEKQGNLEDALISYERAKTKCGNDKAMEKDCLQRKLKILKRRNKYAEAKTTGEQLEKLYEGKDSMTECELLDIDRHMVDLTLDQKQLIDQDKGNDAKNALKETKLAYQHALQAAEDTGDIKMKMQAHEGLAAVCYRKEDFEGCKKCLEMAKVSATFSSDKARLAEKLEHLERTKK
ncbi:hypothetical protein MAR_024934 [Mya arenaria]|uniref:Uncharacterized protein n=1 Tax=Mya arenaria TaxID=6604 RepID=A0ABY7DS77_MYAAR|nr:hypothetical protein MAR_024934 [Mya arenaria]